MERCDIVVVGAGAAGLAAGIFAAEATRASAPTPSVVLLDSASAIGAKILISGGGRCNVTHASVCADDFNGSRPVVRNVLAAFDAQATVRWCVSLGVALKREDTGKLFPVTDRARTVVEALLRRCAELHVAIRTAHRVCDLRVQDGSDASAPAVRFVVEHAQGTLQARCVIMATGGRSLPRTGSDGHGWELVRRVGHHVTTPFPALVPLVLHADSFHAELSGVSQPVELSTFADDQRVDHRAGSLLWTHFGISGPVVLDASRHWVCAQARARVVTMRCNFLPGKSFADVERLLLDTAKARPRSSIGRVLSEWLPDRLAAALALATGIDPGGSMSRLTREQRRTLVHAVTAFALPIERERGWDYAEVTAGGVPLDEVDYRTMQSRKVPGLFLAGEMLDCDGRIGGFNFQWAWATGYLAGRAAARTGPHSIRR